MLTTMTPEEFRAASRERELEEWRNINRFCGKCASPMKAHDNPEEHALVCPKCGYIAYSKLSPAVIVLVTKGDKILLQRNTHYRLRNWTLVAGCSICRLLQEKSAEFSSAKDTCKATRMLRIILLHFGDVDVGVEHKY